MLESITAGSFEAVHDALVRAGRTTTAAIAARLGIPPSTVSRHLNALADTGLAVRQRDGREVFYQIRRNGYVSFTGPMHSPRGKEWAHLQWRTDQPIDWRFPLVARVPDPDAQTTLRRLLDACDERGLFHPWLAAGQTRRDPETWPGLHFVVFGSCARGDARADSDLDLLVLADRPDTASRWHETVEDAVQELNVHAPRGIDLVMVRPEPSHEPDLTTEPRLQRVHPGGRRTEAMPESLMAAVRAEGVTVYAADGATFLVEAWRGQRG